MSKTFRAICKILYRYYDYKCRYEFTLKPLNYHNRQKIKFKLRYNIGLDKLDNYKVINIGNQNVTKYITAFDSIENHLTELPLIIYNFKSLTYLCFTANKLEYVPSFICNFKFLKSLNLSNNELKELPLSIGNLVLLEEISLGYNKLTEIPSSIGNLVLLTRLDICYNELTNLPSSIGNLVSLTRFYLHCNRLTNLPSSIYNHKSLKCLYVSHNQLTNEYISHLSSLLPNCGIISTSSCIFVISSGSISHAFRLRILHMLMEGR